MLKSYYQFLGNFQLYVQRVHHEFTLSLPFYMYFQNESALGISYLQLEVGYQESIIWSDESLIDGAP
ncbi:hypothetical protein QE382_002673 [Sphingobacterium zeae]|uniref:Uncharacterized protein n=1 Tax=Sphingobacterium zeae TaxID=1776859 RepID=A0ABU0U6V4_9SPHI|nr:hypothetical protein [Sphingobacterium zeae]